MRGKRQIEREYLFPKIVGESSQILWWHNFEFSQYAFLQYAPALTNNMHITVFDALQIVDSCTTKQELRAGILCAADKMDSVRQVRNVLLKSAKIDPQNAVVADEICLPPFKGLKKTLNRS